MRFSREESDYRWFEAAKSYEQELSSMAITGSSAGEYWQRIGFCYSLASRQAGDVEGFKRLRQLAVEAYERAAQLYIQENSPENRGKGWECLAIAAYNFSSIAPNSMEKKKTLENCLILGKKAQKAFKSIGDDLNYGKTCIMLALCISDLHRIIPTSAGKIRIIQEGFNDATTAVSILSEHENKDDLILALCLSSILGVCLSEVSNQEEQKNLNAICSKYSKEAVELSKEVDNPYSKAMALFAGANYITWFEEEIEKRNSLAYPEEMLRQASIINDNYLKGNAHFLLAYAVYADIREEADPEKRKQKYADIIKYSESAIQHLQLVCEEPDIADTYLFYSESYFFLAKEFAVTALEKLPILKKAIRIGEKGLEYATRSGSPYALEVNLHSLSRTYYYYSILESKKDKRNRLLNRALKYRKEYIKSTKKAFSSNPWYTGIGLIYEAQIEAELAGLEKKKEKKVGLFEDAVTHMEKGVSSCKKTLEYADVPAVIVRIAENEDILGRMLEENFFLSGKKENLIKANEIYADAAKNYTKIDLPSRAAESFWRIAGNQDRLGDYRKAAQNFENAYAQYKFAAQRITQFNDFYLDYATYVKAWSEIESAKLAHSNEEYAVAKQHYGKAANLLKQSKSWMHLSSNFHAWSLLEQAEDFSRKENCQQSIESFKEAIRLFQESKRLLSLKLSGIDKTDELDLTKRLIEVSDAREEYSQGRIAVEEAKILDKKGDHAASSEKYGNAAAVFQGLLRVNSEQIGNEAKPLFYLCQAWQKMTMAEVRASPAMYEEAAELFRLANEHTPSESASLLALAHSSFCKALGAGTEFEITRNMTMYTEAKKYMNGAANYYLKAGFEAFSEYAKATQRLFDAYVFTDNAKKETDPEKEAKYYLMAEKVLQISSESFSRANYIEKTRQVQRLLRKVQEEKDLALSLSEVIHSPTITSSTAGLTTLSLSEEKAVGLERFAHADIQAKLVKQENEVKVGQYVSLEVQIVNVGKEPVLLTKIENIVPTGFQLIGKPDYCSLEDANLAFKGRQLAPLKTDEIRIVIRPFRRGSFEIKPRITCVDEIARSLFFNPETLTLNVSENILPARVTTGYSDLDDLLFGGIPEKYAVILTSPSNDEREKLVNKFLETGAKSGQTTFCVTSDIGGAKALAEEFRSNFYIFICNPRADVMIDNAPNVFKLNSLENLTDINISLIKAFRSLDSSQTGPRRICIEVLSDILLQHHAVITRKWLGALLPDLRSKGFTTLAVINPQMHSQEEVEAITGQFEGEIKIYEKETEKGIEQFLRIRKLYSQRYLEAEIVLSRD